MKTQFKGSRSTTMLSVLTVLGLQAGFMKAQQVYDTFEGSAVVTYTTTKTAKLDTLAENPAPDVNNESGKCAKFTRSRQRYDYLKMYPQGKIADVSAYASYDGNAPKMKMKVYTTAPVGTIIEIQLGKRSGVAYPDGTHSQYQATTTKTNAWEELVFQYVVSPKGSKTSNNEVDQLTVLFNPNTSTNHIYYFDDLTGPAVTPAQQNTAKSWRKR